MITIDLIPESISHLADNQTVELFYLQARSLIWRGLLEVEADVVFQLAALGLQAAHGDYQVCFRLLQYPQDKMHFTRK